MSSFCPVFISPRQSHSFSALVEDYLEGKEELQSFYRFSPNDSGMSEAISQRAHFPVNRKVLVDCIQQKYDALSLLDAESDGLVRGNIKMLLHETTFTVCTAHQPNLLTGYLYFIYKILHTVKLASHLKQVHPQYDFVPVYYMGAEDNDLEELGSFYYEGETYRWNGNGQSGAVGRMKAEGLTEMLNRLFRVLGPPGAHLEDLKSILLNAYNSEHSIADATQYLVHQLFKKYGLVIVNADEYALKEQFKDVMYDDLFLHTAEELVRKQSELLNEDYKAQAYARPINLFYMVEGVRERIEYRDELWRVMGTELSFTEDELKKEMENHPNRFSPNVILRGLYQESILPNVAFIGGGSEVAYWMQLLPVFDHYKKFFPPLILRQSVLFVDEQAARLQSELKLTTEELFQPEQEIVQHILHRLHPEAWDFKEIQQLQAQLLTALERKAKAVTKEMLLSVAAMNKHIDRHINGVQKKLQRAYRKKEAVQWQRLEKLKGMLYPEGNLQERKENFIRYYPYHGSAWLDELLVHILPYGDLFLILYIRNHPH